MKVGRWSNAAGSNNAAVPDGWPEGQLPSTINNCAREMMAAIRTLIEDAQYIDQDFTPTFITATSFSVPGNQTSAMHIGRRLKCFDATAGVQQVIYGTIISASFTAVTTVNLENDAGSLTSSLSSFGISVIANTPNNALPRNLVLTVSSIAVLGGMSVVGALAGASLAISGNAVISGNATFSGSMTVSGEVVAVNTPRAWVFFKDSVSSGAACVIKSAYNVSTVSRSSTGTYKISFITLLPDADYCVIPYYAGGQWGNFETVDRSATIAAYKFALEVSAGVTINGTGNFHIAFFR
jgi:hypothetical protein